MLQNRIYRGDITHKGRSYPGEHRAIIDQTLWDQVQTQLTRNRDERAYARESALLGGMLFDADGARLTPTHATKNARRYRYYVSAALVRGTAASQQSWRIPAADLDAIVIQTLRSMLLDAPLLLETLDGKDHGCSRARLLLEIGQHLARRIESEPRAQTRADLMAIGCRVVVSTGRVEVQISCIHLLRRLSGTEPDQLERSPVSEYIRRSVSASLKRAGRDMRMIDDGAIRRHVPDRNLLRLLARAHDLNKRLMTDPTLTVAQLADQEDLSVPYVYRLLRLPWLAPEIVTAITRK